MNKAIDNFIIIATVIVAILGVILIAYSWKTTRDEVNQNHRNKRQVKSMA